MPRRLLSAAIAASLLTLGVAGCAQSAHDTADSAGACANPLHPGVLSDTATASLDAIDANGVTDILNAQRSVRVASSQPDVVAAAGDIVTANVAMFDVESGDLLDVSERGARLVLPEDLRADVTTALESEQSGMLTLDVLVATALLCASPGETIVLGATAAQSAATQLSPSATLTVIEVLDVFPATVSGWARTLPNGFPAVTTDETGRPGIVLPPLDPPTEQRIAIRVAGSGPEITEQSSVIGNILTVSWTGAVQLNSWESGMVGFGTEEASNPEFEFRSQLTGQRVGSQVVILDPDGETPVVHVVDIIAVA